MRWRSRIIDLALRAYATTNRLGLLDHPMGRAFFLRSYFLYKELVEDPFAGLARRRPDLFRGGHIIDVGANVGYTAFVFSRVVSPGFKVFAFEPEGRNFSMLLEMLDRLRVGDSVVPLRMAVGARNGTVDLWLNEGHHGDHRVMTESLRRDGRTEELPLVSLDGFTEERGIATDVRFVKIDVQGYELEVCRGMEKTIERNPRMAVAVEYFPAGMREMGYAPDALLAFFRDRGFRVQAIGSRGDLDEDVDRVIGSEDFGSRGGVDLLCTRDG